ncbi:hypothetical protein EBU94_07325, partial [bacterium]|nr:hypothetical protein [bacterium]
TEDSNAIRRRSNAREIIEKVLRLNELKNQIENSIRITISTTQFIDDYKIDFKQISNAPVPFWLNEYKKLGINIKSNWAVQWPGGYPKSSKVIYHDLNVELPDKCSLLDETFTIRSNGDVVVCCYDLTSLKVIGNVSETTISSIINSTEYLQFKNNFSNKIYSEPCKSCAVVTGKKYLGKSLLLDIV